jgi:hypothetical protein
MTRIAALVLVSIGALVFLSGCSDPTEPEPKPEEIVNPDKPNANDRILSQVVIGDASKWNSLYEVARDNAGGYYFRGGYNNFYSVGRLTPSGTLSWFFRTSHTPTGVCVGPPAGVVPNGLVVAGKQDVDGDGDSDVGFVSLLTSGGSLVNQLVYSADASDVWLNSIAHVADSTFLILGGVRALAEEQPFVATIVMTSAGQIEKKHQTVINTLPGRFSDSAADPALPVGATWSFYVTSSQSDAPGAVHKISVAWPELEPWTVDWSREVSVPSVQASWVNDVCFFDGNLYVAGGIQDSDKTPQPSNGGYWTSAFVGSITSSGDPRWMKVVRVTQHSDVFHSVVASPQEVFAVGECAEFYRQDNAFGYGWISRLSASTGGVISNWVFGDDRYRSGFSDCILDGSTMRCGGWTQQEVSGGYQGWFCKLNVSPTLAESPLSLPAPVHAGDGAVREDRRARPGSD